MVRAALSVAAIYALVSGHGSLWLLTCNRGCSGEARQAVGHVLRVDPRTARVLKSSVLPRPQAIAVGSHGVYALDFWRDRIRLLDSRTLHVVRSLKLKLPFRFSAHDNAFLPFAVAVGPGAVWVATDRGVLARVDLRVTRVVATVRLPFDAFGGMAAGPHAVWVAESLAGLYRVDPRTNRVAARIRMEGFDAEQVVVCDGKVLVLGAAASVQRDLPNREYLVRVLRDGAKRIGRLPSGPLAYTCGAGSLWLGQQGGSRLERIDPANGRVVAQRRAKIGTALAYAGGKLWTARPDGAVRQLGM